MDAGTIYFIFAQILHGMALIPLRVANRTGQESVCVLLCSFIKTNHCLNGKPLQVSGLPYLTP